MSEKQIGLSRGMAVRLGIMVLVLIAAGIFWPTMSDGLRVMCFVVGAGIALYGGFRAWRGRAA